MEGQEFDRSRFLKQELVRISGEAFTEATFILIDIASECGKSQAETVRLMIAFKKAAIVFDDD